MAFENANKSSDKGKNNSSRQLCNIARFSTSHYKKYHLCYSRVLLVAILH